MLTAQFPSSLVVGVEAIIVVPPPHPNMLNYRHAPRLVIRFIKISARVEKAAGSGKAEHRIHYSIVEIQVEPSMFLACLA